MSDIFQLVEKNLCVEDIDDFREQVGVDLFEVMDKRGSSDLDTKVLAGLIWIAKRHEDPTYTLEQARREPIMPLVESSGKGSPTAPSKSSKKPSSPKRKR